jgi:hypothetical protein
MISGRIPNADAVRKRRGFPKSIIAVVRVSIPGSTSVTVGTTFLKIVEGVARKPWGIRSSMR